MTTQSPATILVTIPNCTATHVLGSTSILLASGELSLIKSSSTVLAAPSVGAPVAAEDLQASTTAPTQTLPHTPAQSEPVFTLQIGTLAFPLLKDTVFGTIAASPLIYLFTPELGPAGQAALGGYVKLELPKEAGDEGSDAGKRQEAFERALIGEGLLKEGWEAAGDDIGRSARESMAHGAAGLDRVAEGQQSHPPPLNPTTFSPTTHSFLESSAQNTGSASDWTKSASQTVSDAASSAGKWIGSTVGGISGAVSNSRVGEMVASSLATETGRVPPEALDEDEENEEDVRRSMTGDAVAGAKAASKGISTGTSNLTSSLSTTTTSTISSRYGADAANAATKAGETARNVGKVAKDAAMAGTNAVMTAGEGAVGAFQGGEGSAKREDSTEEVSLE